MQDLDRDGAADAGVLGLVDPAHPALAEHRVDPVAAIEDTADRDDTGVVL